jgi:hypothetical protein
MKVRAALLMLMVVPVLASVRSPASAKGAWTATLSGPGLDAPVVIGSKAGRDVNRVANLSGMYSTLFETQPDLTLDDEPEGDLGPRFEIAYDFRAPDIEGSVVRQDVYPYARPYPVTYVEPGQRVFDQAESYGGWYEAGPRLLRFLQTEGLPDLETATSAASDQSGSGRDAAPPGPPGVDPSRSGSSWIVVLVVAAIVIAGSVLVVARRRRPGAAHA